MNFRKQNSTCFYYARPPRRKWNRNFVTRRKCQKKLKNNETSYIWQRIRQLQCSNAKFVQTIEFNWRRSDKQTSVLRVGLQNSVTTHVHKDLPIWKTNLFPANFAPNLNQKIRNRIRIFFLEQIYYLVSKYTRFNAREDKFNPKFAQNSRWLPLGSMRSEQKITKSTLFLHTKISAAHTIVDKKATSCRHLSYNCSSITL